MARPYSLDFRKKVLEAYEDKEGSMAKWADRFKVSINFIADLTKRYRETGQITPKPRRGGPQRVMTKSGEEFLVQQLNHQPDLTVKELKDKYNQHFKSVSLSTIARALKQLNITRKKKQHSIPENIV